MKKEILVHPDELTEKSIRRAKALGISAIGIHPAGGDLADETLSDLLALAKTDEFRRKIDYARSEGLTVEYEFHAMKSLLPRSLFPTHPEFFRMNEDGVRTPDNNCCPSSAGALERIGENARRIAKQLYGSSHRYYFWPDDLRGRDCKCPLCRALSSSDQQLLMANAILSALRKDDPAASVCYIAYHDSILPPTSVRPADGVFLEFAPMDRYRYDKETGWSVDPVETVLAQLDALCKVFPKGSAKILEYWLDNSMYSRWKKPPKKFLPDNAQILRDLSVYESAGYTDVASFACYLGEDYEALYGEPDLSAFAGEN